MLRATVAHGVVADDGGSDANDVGNEDDGIDGCGDDYGLNSCDGGDDGDDDGSNAVAVALAVKNR